MLGSKPTTTSMGGPIFTSHQILFPGLQQGHIYINTFPECVCVQSHIAEGDHVMFNKNTGSVTSAPAFFMFYIEQFNSMIQ